MACVEENYGHTHEITLCIKQTSLVGDEMMSLLAVPVEIWGGMEVISAGVKETALV